MLNPLLNLATINAMSDPYATVIIETIAEKKRATFNELKQSTNLSNDGLRTQLERLQKYALIRGELSEPENGSYSYYKLTKLGEVFRSLLHDMLHKSAPAQPDQTSDCFTIDAESFLQLYEKKSIKGLKQIFNHCKLIFTNFDYAKLESVINNTEDAKLEEFLADEDRIVVHTSYKDSDSVKIENYLRRNKKLSQNEARLVVTAFGNNASLITENQDKVANAARSLGIMCTNSNAVMRLREDDNIWDKFYELSLQESDPKNINFQIGNNSIPLLKKN